MASFIAGTPYAIGALLRLCRAGYFSHLKGSVLGLHLVFETNILVQGVAEFGVVHS